MTFEQFMIKWNGQYCEVAGSSAKNQCVDLANAYIRDVLLLPIIEWTNATDFPTKASKSDYEWIANTPTNIPMRGDIVVWNGAIGHIAIIVEATVNSFKSFDQNYPVGSPCHVQAHNYNNVKGWLRAKKPPAVITVPTTPALPVPDKADQIKRAYKALTGVWVKQEEIDPWIKRDLSLDDTMVKIMEGDGRFFNLWIKPHLDKQAAEFEKQISKVVAGADTLQKEFELYKKQHPQPKADEVIEETVKTYPVTPKTPPVSLDPEVKAQLVNLLQSLKKYWPF